MRDYMLKETIFLMYSSIGNHDYDTKTDMFFAKQIIMAEILETFLCSTLLISQSRKNFLQDQILAK